MTTPQTPVQLPPLPEAPPNSLPDHAECALRVENSDFLAERVADGGYGPEHDSKLATQLHRFIYEYDDADPYSSAWFLHRLELVLDEAKAEGARAALEAQKAEPTQPIGTVHLDSMGEISTKWDLLMVEGLDFPFNVYTQPQAQKAAAPACRSKSVQSDQQGGLSLTGDAQLAAAPAPSPEVDADCRQTVVWSLMASKGWASGYAEAYVENWLDGFGAAAAKVLVPLSDEQWVSDAWLDSVSSRPFEAQRLAVFAAKAQDRIALPINVELMALTSWLIDGCPGGPWRGFERVNNIINILEKRNAAI